MRWSCCAVESFGLIYPNARMLDPSCRLKQIIYMQRLQLFALNCVLSAQPEMPSMLLAQPPAISHLSPPHMPPLVDVSAAEAMRVDWYRIQACWKLFALIIRWLMFATDDDESWSADVSRFWFASCCVLLCVFVFVCMLCAILMCWLSLCCWWAVYWIGWGFCINAVNN